MSKQLWQSGSVEPWKVMHKSLDRLVQENTTDKLQELNSWYESQLPAAIAGRAPKQHVTQAELVKLVDWKLTRGKWRPKLLDYAKAATEQQVLEASSSAFALLANSSSSSSAAAAAGASTAAAAAEGKIAGKGKRKATAKDDAAPKRAKTGAIAAGDAEEAGGDVGAAAPSTAVVKAALDALTVLKGVGPATASALLAAADVSGSCPFMADEALEAAQGSRDYTAKAYLLLVESLRQKAAWLAQQEPGTAWTAVLVERCLWAATLQAKGPPAAAAPKATGKKQAAAKKKK